MQTGPFITMRGLLLLSVAFLAPSIGLAAPASHDGALNKRENLCNLSAPPSLCVPDDSVTVEETAERAYKFYRAFVVDGDPRTMFSLIDSEYIVSPPHVFTRGWRLTAIKQHHPGFQSGPDVIWPLFCSGNKIGTEANTSWCFDASTNMSYAQYSVTDRWRWVGGCVHEHWDQDEVIPKDKCYKLNSTSH